MRHRRRGLSRGDRRRRVARAPCADAAASSADESDGRRAPPARPRSRHSSRRLQATAAPLRGAALAEVDVIEDAYVLCAGEIDRGASGRMRDLPTLDGEVGGDRRARALRDPRARRLPHARALCRRPRGGVRAPRGRRVLRGAARSGRRNPVHRPRDARSRPRTSCAPPSRTHRSWMLRAGTTTFEAKSGYGLDRDTELASLQAIRDAGGIPTWLGAHAVAARVRRRGCATSTSSSPQVLPGCRRARGSRGRLPRARRVRRRRRRGAI